MQKLDLEGKKNEIRITLHGKSQLEERLMRSYVQVVKKKNKEQNEEKVKTERNIPSSATISEAKREKTRRIRE